MERKQLKRTARRTLGRHYVLLTALCLLGSLLWGRAALTANLARAASTGRLPDLATASLPAGAEAGRTLWALAQDGPAASQALWARERELSGQGSGALGRSRGVLAGAVNKAQSGAYMADALAGLERLTGSPRAGLVLLAVLWAGGLFLVWSLVQNVYAVVLGRLVLESRVYPQVPLSRAFSFLPLRRWGRAAAALLWRALFQLLWSLTVVGGAVKACAYFPVPYLLAQDPELKPRQALDLAQRMMRGHKGELFRLELSFLGWRVLSLLSLGVSGALYSRPYRQAARGEFYREVRAQWLALHPEDRAARGDRWLFARPDDAALAGAYGDVASRRAAAAQAPELPGLAGALARYFGVLLRRGPRELAYAHAAEERSRLAVLEAEAAGRRYPLRLAPGRPAGDRRDQRPAPAGRCYWIWSLVAMFFLFSVLGWLWEVGYAAVVEGRLVNRGVLHGPWLPLYGSGGCLMLILLARFRARPGAFFGLSMALCGALEYGTGLWLERLKGQRWWSYDGYFLNLQGRVCAEGLLLFAAGGCAVVYLLAPRLDRWLSRTPGRALVGVCLALMALFCLDEVWSAFRPNVGNGITNSVPAQPGRPPDGPPLEGAGLRSA